MVQNKISVKLNKLFGLHVFDCFKPPCLLGCGGPYLVFHELYQFYHPNAGAPCSRTPEENYFLFSFLKMMWTYTGNDLKSKIRDNKRETCQHKSTYIRTSPHRSEHVSISHLTTQRFADSPHSLSLRNSHSNSNS